MSVMHQEIKQASIPSDSLVSYENRNSTWEDANPVFYCKSCHRCWEKARNYEYRSDIELHFYSPDIIPTYGKERRTCPECTKQ